MSSADKSEVLVSPRSDPDARARRRRPAETSPATSPSRFHRENLQASTPLLFFSAVTFSIAVATRLGLAFQGSLQSSIGLLALAIGVVTLVSGLAALFFGDFHEETTARAEPNEA